MTNTAEVPANTFLLGEFSVMFNRPALIASVNMRTKCSMWRRNDDRVVVHSAGYGSIDERIKDLTCRNFTAEDFKKDEMNLARSLISSFVKTYGVRSGFEMEVYSEIPKTCKGLSRSGSFLSAALGSLASFSEIPLKKEDYFNFLKPRQAEAHGGKASGTETFSHVYGGINKVKADGSREDVGNPGFRVVIGDTGIETKTSDTVPYVLSGWEKDRESYEEVFNDIEELVENGVRAIKNGDIRDLGYLMNKNQDYLAMDLGVSSRKLNKLIKASREAGAYGAKLSGGGRGGVMIALTNMNRQDEIAKAVARAGGTPYKTAIGVEGLREEKNLKM